MKKTGEERTRTQAKEQLLKILKPGDMVYTVLRHVSLSGMSRRIDLYVFKGDKPLRITWIVAALLDYRMSVKGGLVVNGCGMDMGFHVVYALSSALFRIGETFDEKAARSLNHEWL